MQPNSAHRAYQSSKTIRVWVYIIRRQYREVLFAYPDMTDLASDVQITQRLRGERVSNFDDIMLLLKWAFNKAYTS